MNDRLALASSHFNITGGRRQDTPDSFRIVTSLPTVSGHTAALYAVSEASSPGPMGARARRIAIDAIEHEYASTFEGSPASRLKLAAQTASDALRAEFEGHVRVGLSAIVVEGRTVYLLQVPPSQAYVLHGGSLHSVAAAPRDGAPAASSPFAESLGTIQEPTISIFRDQMEVDDVLVLCTTWFPEELDGDELRSAFSAEEAEEINEYLFDFARDRRAADATCITLQAVPEDIALNEPVTEIPWEEEEPGPSLMDRVDEAVQALANVGQFVSTELRPSGRRRDRHLEARLADNGSARPRSPESPAATMTAVDDLSPPPDERPDERRPREPSSSWDDVDVKTPMPSMQYTAATGATEQGTEEIPIVSEVEDTVPEGNDPPDQETAASRWEAAGDDSNHPVDAEPAPEPTPPRDEPRRSRTVRPSSVDLDEINSFIQSTPNLGNVAPPIQAFPDTSIAPERIYPTSGGLPPGRRPRRLGGVVRPSRRESPLYRNTPVLEPRVGGIDLGRARGRLFPSSFKISNIPPALILWSVAAVALVVVLAVVYVVFRHHPSAVSLPNYPAKARQHADLALKSSNPVFQDRQLSLALTDLSLARENHMSSARIAQAAAYVQNVSDRIHAIIRIHNPAVVANFNKFTNARPQQLAGGAGALFVLDSGGEALYAVSGNGAPARVASAGDQIGSIIWGDPESLTSDGPTMLSLDQKFNLLTCGSTSAPCSSATTSALQLARPPGNLNIVSATTYNGNVYFLDGGTGQIWKYVGNGQGYDTSPAPYLVNADPKGLANAVSLAIDGDVYVGRVDGTIVKYTEGKQVPFTMSLPFSLSHISQIYTRADLYAIYIAEPANDRIVEMGKKGHYIRAFALPPPVANNFRGLTISSDGHTMYILTGRRVIRVPTRS